MPAGGDALRPTPRTGNQGGDRLTVRLVRGRPVLDQRLTALEDAGIDRDRLIIDPGMGYFLGSTPEPSLAVLAGLGKLKERFGVPVLISPSRKSFLRTLTGTDLDRIGPATLAAELHAASQGVDFIRTHDVAALNDALTVFSALSAGTPTAGTAGGSGSADPTT